MRILERAYPLLERSARFCNAVGWAGTQAVGLGLLDAEELVRLTVERFERSDYSEHAYAESGLWLWEREAVRRFFPSAGRILVGAAGAGREMIALHRAGYVVEGFECAHALVDAGQTLLRDVGCGGRLVHAPPGTVPAFDGPFDGAVMGWSGYMYIPHRAQRVRLLQDFRQLLRPGAPVLLSFQTREHCERRMAWSATGANWIRRVRRVPPVSPGDCLDRGFKHWFNREEVFGELAAADLRPAWYSVDSYGWAVGRA